MNNEKDTLLLEIAEAWNIQDLGSFLEMVKDLTDRASRCGYISFDNKSICRKCGSFHIFKSIKDK